MVLPFNLELRSSFVTTIYILLIVNAYNLKTWHSQLAFKKRIQIKLVPELVLLWCLPLLSNRLEDESVLNHISNDPRCQFEHTQTFMTV